VTASARRAGPASRDAGAVWVGGRVLAVDVGQGTADVLLALPGEPLENAVRLVVPSRTRIVADEIAAATAAGDAVVFTGPVMGGGPSGSAMKRHVAAGLRFIAGESAARTFADDLDRVRERGVEVVDDAEAAALAADVGGDRAASRAGPERNAGGVVTVRSGDLDVAGFRGALSRLGVEPRFDVVCVAVQDHGFTLDGSNRVFRFALWEQAVAERRPLAALFHERPAIPAALTRLRAAADLAVALGDGAPVLAADTGPAALYGVMPEDEGDGVLVNVGNGHVVCAVARAGRLAGVFEHHTGALDGRGLEDRLRRFLAGHLTSAGVREDGGHGAVLAPDALAGLEPARDTPLLVTGPRREMLRGAGLRLEFAAPHGDMMLTGCYGLLRAARERGLTSQPV
jgi:uncharacterized protein (DUF1786 family)